MVDCEIFKLRILKRHMSYLQTMRILQILCNRTKQTFRHTILPQFAHRTILEHCHTHDIPLEGACEGSLACSTCHVVLPQDIYKKLKPATEEEEDMLDLAVGLTSTSRLGCQIRLEDLCEASEGELTVTLPEQTRNMAVDGYVAKPH